MYRHYVFFFRGVVYTSSFASIFTPIVAQALIRRKTGFIDSHRPIAEGDNGSQRAEKFPCRGGALCEVVLSLIPNLACFTSLATSSATARIKRSGSTYQYPLYRSVPIIPANTYRPCSFQTRLLALQTSAYKIKPYNCYLFSTSILQFRVLLAFENSEALSSLALRREAFFLRNSRYARGESSQGRLEFV